MSPVLIPVLPPMLYAFNASSEGVVASTGASNFSTVASDSPSFLRSFPAVFPKVLSTSRLLPPPLARWPACPRHRN